MVVGCGALGNETIKNLALFGVGNLILVDFDEVEYSNLTRSILFTQEDALMHRYKVEAAEESVKRINPNINVTTIVGDISNSVGVGVCHCVNRDICGYKMFEGLDVARESLLEIFSALRRDVNLLSGDTVEEIAFACDGLGFDKREFIFALNVFEELGLVERCDGRLTVYRGVKAELNDSAIYRKVCLLQKLDD